MEFDPHERAYLLDMRLLTTDLEGRDVFVGLSVEESEEYFAFTRPGGTDLRPGEDWEQQHARGERYLELHDKMEKAKFELIAAEHVLRTMRPTKN